MEKIVQFEDIRLNSDEGDEVYTDGFRDNLSENVYDVSYFYQMGWQITKIVLPCAFPQCIRDGINDSLVCKIGETLYPITLNEGDYTMNRLTAHLQTSINTELSISCMVAYSQITKLLTITNDDTSEFSITTASTCEEIIGLGSSDLTFPVSTATSFPNVPDLNNVRMVQIHSNLANKRNYSSTLKGSSDVVLALPVKSLSGTIIYENKTDLFTNLSSNLSYLEFRLTDQKNQVLNNRGVSWTICIRLKKSFMRPLLPPELLLSQGKHESKTEKKDRVDKGKEKSKDSI